MNKKVENKKLFVIKVAIFCVIAVMMIMPLIWAVSVSLQGRGKAFEMPPKFFQLPLMFENYAEVLRKYDFAKYFLNTLRIALINIVGVVLSNSMIAFGFAKYDSKSLRVLFFVGLCTMYVPEITMLVPRYVIWSKLGFLDSYVPLTVTSYFGSIAWIFLMRQHFKSIPNALYEAAYLDGANPIYTWWKVYMPLSKPMLATLVLRQFMASWNDLMNPLLYITSKNKYTVSLAMSVFSVDVNGRTELLMAGAVLTMLPVIIVYLFTQKYFVGGVVSSGVKG